MISSVEFFNGIRRNEMGVVCSFLNSGGDVNARDKNGMTALMISIDYGNVEIVEYLLRSGSKPDVTDKWGQTALMLAAGRNHSTIAKLLVEAGANISLKANNGLTAKQYAAENGGKDVEAFLGSYKKKFLWRR